MEQYCKSTRNLAFLHFMASLGGRIGIHQHDLLMKHLIPMSSNNSSTTFDCRAVLLYADKDESALEKDEMESQDDVQSGDSYWAFLTPEATSFLQKYHNQRKRNGEIFTDDTPIFRTQYQAIYGDDNVIQLSRNGAISLMHRILGSTSINRTKKGRRFDIQIDHGFRKRFNTIMKLDNNVNSNITEKMLGHKNGLDGVYFAPTRQQCFSEFVKAIPQLTISSTERQKQKIEIQKNQIDELEGERTKVHELSRDMTTVRARNKVLENMVIDNQTVMSGLVVDKQDESDRKSELFQMILDLTKEVQEIKSKK